MPGSTGMAYSSNVGRPKGWLGSKIIPLHHISRLNPDGVAAGRTRTNLDSVDLNRQNVCTKWGMSEAMLKISDVCLG